MTVTLGMELAPVMDDVIRVLQQHRPVTQLQVLEVLVARMAMGRTHRHEQDLILASFTKHVKQIMADWRRYDAEGTHA